MIELVLIILMFFFIGFMFLVMGPRIFTKISENILAEEDLTEEETKKQQEEQFLQLNTWLTPYIDEISSQIVNKVVGAITDQNKTLRTLQANAGKQERVMVKQMQDADFEAFIETHPQGALIQAALDQKMIPKAWVKAIKKNPALLDMFMPRIEPFLAQLQDQLIPDSLNQSISNPGNQTSGIDLSFLK